MCFFQLVVQQMNIIFKTQTFLSQHLKYTNTALCIVALCPGNMPVVVVEIWQTRTVDQRNYMFMRKRIVQGYANYLTRGCE